MSTSITTTTSQGVEPLQLAIPLGQLSRRPETTSIDAFTQDSSQDASEIRISKWQVEFCLSESHLDSGIFLHFFTLRPTQTSK